MRSSFGWGDWLAVCGLKREAAIWGGDAVVGGGRSDLLADRLEAAIATRRPAGLISFGLCGALAGPLRVGDTVAATGVATLAGEMWPADPEALTVLATLATAPPSTMLGSDAVVSDIAGKRALASRFATVDMESHLAARAAAAHGLKLAVLRVVSDSAGDSLPPAAVAGMGADGGVDAGAVLGALLRDPGQLPALIRLGRDSGRAFERLKATRRALR